MSPPRPRAGPAPTADATVAAIEDTRGPRSRRTNTGGGAEEIGRVMRIDDVTGHGLDGWGHPVLGGHARRPRPPRGRR